MNLKLTAVAVAAMLTVVGGAAAVSGTAMSQTDSADAPHDVDVGATYDNGTVAVTVTNGGEAVENATVEIADEEYTTDANGTAVAENVTVEDELDVEVEGDGFEAEQEYTLEDGELTLVSEEYEYESDDEREEDDEREDDERDERDEDAEESENEADDEEADDEADEADDEDDDEDEEADDDDDEEEEEDDDDDDEEEDDD